MAMRKFSLVLVFFVIWQLVQLSTASQDWISLRGCYNYSNEIGLIVPFNEPQACFDRCPNSTAVGLKNSTCICYQSYTYTGLRRDNLCGFKCPGKPWLYCGGESGSNGLMNVYSNDPPQTKDININTDYGFVSVSISESGKTYSASKNDSSGRNGFICYDDAIATDSCHQFDNDPLYTWENASERCHQTGQVLIAFTNIDRCKQPNPLRGVFWIGLYRNSPVSATSATTTSTSLASTSSKPKISTFSSSMTPATTTKLATVSSFSHEWTSSVTGTGTSSEGSPDVVINAVYVSVPVVAAGLAVVVFALICWKRKILCFKPHPNSIEEHVEKNHNGVQTGKINNDSPPEIPYIDPLIDVNVSSCVPSGANRTTFQGHQENIRSIVSLQTCNQEGHYLGSNAEKYEREIGNSTPNYLEGGSEKPGNSFELDDGIHSPASKTEKGKGKRRRKKKKQNHSVPAASKNGEINSDTDNYAELDRYTSGEHRVRNERKGNPNDESRYDEKKRTEKEIKNRDYSNEEQKCTSSKPFAALDPNIQFNRPATASDVHAIVPTVQEKIATYINGSDEVHNELNTSNGENRIEETKKHKRSRKRKKRKENTLFDVPADHPIVEGQTDINSIGSREK